MEKLPDLANVIAGVLVFGQLVDDESVSIWLASVGIAIWAILAGVTMLLAGGEP